MILFCDFTCFLLYFILFYIYFFLLWFLLHSIIKIYHIFFFRFLKSEHSILKLLGLRYLRPRNTSRLIEISHKEIRLYKQLSNFYVIHDVSEKEK